MKNQQLSKYTDTTVDYYNQNASEFFSRTRDLNMDTIYQRFLSHLAPGNHILDAGCGSGRDTLYFIQHGYKLTAFDASEQLARPASQLTGLAISVKSFLDITYQDQFDAIWACASLLHVPKLLMDDAFFRLIAALRVNGVFYASFKYGNEESIREGRVFSNYTEETFNELMKNHSRLSIIEMWQTTDVRSDRSEDKWLNIIMCKIA